MLIKYVISFTLSVHFCNLLRYVVHPLYTISYFSLISDLCFCVTTGWCLENRMPAFIISLESSPPQMPLIFATLSGSLQTQFSPSCRLSCFVHFSLVFLKLTCQRSRCSPFLPHCAFPESKNDILFNFLFPEPNAVKDTSVDTPLVATTKITQAVLLHWNLISKEMNERLSDTP